MVIRRPRSPKTDLFLVSLVFSALAVVSTVQGYPGVGFLLAASGVVFAYLSGDDK